MLLPPETEKKSKQSLNYKGQDISSSVSGKPGALLPKSRLCKTKQSLSLS